MHCTSCLHFWMADWRQRNIADGSHAKQQHIADGTVAATRIAKSKSQTTSDESMRLSANPLALIGIPEKPSLGSL